jgi:predicted HAD superfamily Cof-like phosphohydrolase
MLRDDTQNLMLVAPAMLISSITILNVNIDKEKLKKSLKGYFIMTDMFKDVIDFHTAFGILNSNQAVFPDENTRNLRMKLLKEEFDEYTEAEENNDFVEVADALADLIYIACGTAASYGIPLNEVFEEVHRSNMAKLVDGKPLKRADGKVIKPEGWTPPDIEGVIKKQHENNTLL